MKDFYLDQQHLSENENDNNLKADLIERGASLDLLSTAGGAKT